MEISAQSGITECAECCTYVIAEIPVYGVPQVIIREQGGPSFANVRRGPTNKVDNAAIFVSCFRGEVGYLRCFAKLLGS